MLWRRTVRAFFLFRRKGADFKKAQLFLPKSSYAKELLMLEGVSRIGGQQ